MRYAAVAAIALLLAGCRGAAEGPLNGVLVVYGDGREAAAEAFTGSLQKTVVTVDPEPVFSFVFCPRSQLDASLRLRRTVLLLLDSPAEAPEGLRRSAGGYWRGTDVWARGQTFFAAVPESCDASALSRDLELAYNRHLHDYLYQSFVTTSMSSPARMDSLRGLGFSMDVPRSYRTVVWTPERHFVQFQRPVSDEGVIMLSVYWLPGGSVGDAAHAVEQRQLMARREFYDASADSVDRARLEAGPLELHGLRGWVLLGEWRNPEYLNAGGFTSYVLQSGSGMWILDTEVYNPGSEKEPYIREGWLVMNTFSPEG